MKNCSFVILLLLLAANLGLAQGASPDLLEQTKRNARKNNHIEKSLQGQVIGHLFKGHSQALSAFVFRSTEGKHFHVKIDGWQGEALRPFLDKGKTVDLTVTGDPVLLERLIYPSIRYQYVENLFGIQLDALAHFRSIKTDEGSYTHVGKRSWLAPEDQSELITETKILSKKKTNDQRWAYALDNDDTLFLREGDHDRLKSQQHISYIRRLPNIMNFGVFYNAPNSYYAVGIPYLDALKPYDVMDQLRGKIAVIVEKANFEVMEDQHNSKGLLNGLQVRLENQKARLFFDARNGEKVKNLINNQNDFVGYYKNIGEDSLLLYALQSSQKNQMIDNRSEPFSNKAHYDDEVVTYQGKISEAHFKKTDKLAKLQYFVVNDSIHIAVKEVVAINIQKMISEGKEVTVSGYLRKQIPGEVNLKGYTIMAANAITIKGKTFKQQQSAINKML